MRSIEGIERGTPRSRRPADFARGERATRRARPVTPRAAEVFAGESAWRTLKHRVEPNDRVRRARILWHGSHVLCDASSSRALRTCQLNGHLDPVGAAVHSLGSHCARPSSPSTTQMTQPERASRST
jgi:hypothetical protein